MRFLTLTVILVINASQIYSQTSTKVEVNLVGSSGPQLNSLWDLGAKQYGTVCQINPFDALWYLREPCLTYNGTVGCSERSATAYGKCDCNLGDDAYFDYEDTISCVGKVGAMCTSEYTGLIPQKRCTPNADCEPDREGSSLGKCKCLYGYKEIQGKCIKDSSIGDEQRSTPRTTTTTNPAKPPFRLPPITLTEFEGSCSAKSVLLNLNYCNIYGSTVACINEKCQCNIENSVFDADVGMCVSLAGSYCLANPSLFGYKVCTEGADCFPEKGQSFTEYSFGVCTCLYGYITEDNGTCTPDRTITNPSTARVTVIPTTTKAPSTQSTQPSSTTPGGGDEGGKDGAVTATLTLSVTLIAFAVYLQI